MNTKVTLGVVSGLVALMLVFIASRRQSDGITDRLQSNAQTVAELEQRLADLQQTVGRQSRLINQLRAEPPGQAQTEPGQAPLDGEDLWIAIESLVEQHLEDREQRQRREEAMARSRERRNQQLAKQLGLNPFQSQQLAKLLAVAEAYLGVPLTAQLAQNHPNPFNSETAIEYELPQSGENTAHDIRRHGPAGRDVGQWVTCCRDLRPAVGRT